MLSNSFRPWQWTMRERRDFARGLIFILPWLAGFLLFLAYPIAASLYYSFTDYDVLSRSARLVGLDNYRRLLFGDEYIGKVLYNTIYYVWALSTSLKPTEQVYRVPPEWIPKPFVWRNYPDALTYVPFFRYILNTLKAEMGLVDGGVCDYFDPDPRAFLPGPTHFYRGDHLDGDQGIKSAGSRQETISRAARSRCFQFVRLLPART